MSGNDRPRSFERMTDAQLAEVDIRELLLTGLPGDPRLFGEGAVAAGLAMDRLGVFPRSLTFLAEIVRRGGVLFAAGLPEPLPTPHSAELCHAWLTAATEVDGASDQELGDAMARWLDAVALVVDVRQRARR